MPCSSTTARATCAILSVSMLAAPWSSFASERTLRCSSDNYRYHYCRADTDNRVRLDRQISNTDCRRGDNWGYDRGGVWVDRGCAAEFKVGKSSSHHGSDGDKALAAGAAIAGIAILAAVAASKHDQDNVPSWAVGDFSGYDEDERSNVRLSVMPGGSVKGKAGSNSFTGSFSGDQLHAGRHRFRVERSGNGFWATDTQNSRHRVYFNRSGGGY